MSDDLNKESIYTGALLLSEEHLGSISEAVRRTTERLEELKRRCRECDECGGTGEIELFTSYAECDECDGTGSRYEQ